MYMGFSLHHDSQLFSTFHSLSFFEIGGCHLVAFAERSSNLPSNFKMINHRPGNFIFRAGVRIADARRVRPGPPACGGFSLTRKKTLK